MSAHQEFWCPRAGTLLSVHREFPLSLEILTYYPRTRVIKDITGMSVEERTPARAAVPRPAPSPA